MVLSKSSKRDIDLLDDLRHLPAETSWLEFKTNNCDPKLIGKLCSAISNSARMDGVEKGYVIWGIEDEKHQVVGTKFIPGVQKVGNDNLEFWLARMLTPSVPISFREIDHPDGRLVLLEIPAAISAPTMFEGTSYIRIGSATPRLADYHDRYQKLIERLRPFNWETGLAMQYMSLSDVLEFLDYKKYFELTNQPLPSSEDRIIEFMHSDNLVSKDVGNKWNITNLGAILFANDITEFESSLARKAVRFVSYDGNDRAATVVHRQDGQKGYAVGFEGLLNFINALLPRNEHIGKAFRTEHPLFPELSVRELVANSLIHQDMTITGAGPLIELFKDRLEITNPGVPLVEIGRMIDLPPRSRNEALASLMRRMKICEEQGSGLDKVIIEVELFQLPPPLIKAENQSTKVVLYAPRTFADMTPDERVRACYFHAVIKFISDERMRNASLCKRFGIEQRNAAQVSNVIRKALEAELIKAADPDHPRAGYHPIWA